MKQFLIRYNLSVFLLFAGILLLGILGMERIPSTELSKLRLNQLSKIRLDTSQELTPMMMLGKVAVRDFFIPTDSGYVYMGGIFDAPWKVGKTYTANELEGVQSWYIGQSDFYSRKIASGSVYVNIDQGNDQAVKGFLKTMDAYKIENLDSLFIDFRFLGPVDFGAILRLFNQLAPRDRFELGVSIDGHQETEVNSSGRPFFTANHVVFMVNPLVPIAVKKLVLNLATEPGYQVVGISDVVPDTVCLFTDFRVDSKVYRVCTEKWTDDAKSSSISIAPGPQKDSLQIYFQKKVDETWYKNQDSVAMNELVPEMLHKLLP
ncbi:hypothetical protein KUV50_04945 [Membranicola marinus]|uniref:Uncharacterized protein n=1 Tax=Membranihabitans marinus TaxID=1227546 RepID=A0A953HKR8_9BACT|nr:hypothetical protein [Membranihabitans marinus]MBY5957472.1 hypothetical protein [Membranihabitans marinus]